MNFDTFYVSDCHDLVSANQVSWLHDPEGCIPVVEDTLSSVRTVLCIHSHASKDGLCHS